MTDNRTGKADKAAQSVAAALQAESYEALFLQSPLPTWVMDPQSLCFMDVNHAATEEYGYSRAEFLAMTVADLRPSDTPAPLYEKSRRGAAAAAPQRYGSVCHRRKDGSLLWVNVCVQDITCAGTPARLVTAQNVTSLHEATEQLAQQGAYLRQLFHSSPEAIVLLDEQDRILDFNSAFHRLFQYPLPEIRGRCINDVIVPEDRREEAIALSRAALANARVAHDTVRRRRDGSVVDVSTLGYPITVNGRQVGLFVIYRDITESRRLAEQLAYQVTHDAATGLINRHEFERRVQERLDAVRRSEGHHALLLLDVDQLRVVNDTFGYQAGDRVVAAVGNLVRAQLRDTEILGRVGGEEFGVLLAQCSPSEAEAAAQRITAAAAQYRLYWDGSSIPVAVSIGAVPVDRDSTSVAALFSAAETACQVAKSRGRNAVQMFRADDPEVMRIRGERFHAGRLMQCLEDDRFTLFFQRIEAVAGVDGIVSRYEILLRLQDADGEVLRPDAFLPAAERYGLMPAIDRYVISCVLDVLHRKRLAGPMDDVVCVNVSATSLADPEFGSYVLAQLERTGVPPHHLCLEITETAAIANIGSALEFIDCMRAAGCAVALDDFGRGMSSFAYLKSLNVDFLKIDGSFVLDLLSSPLDCAMVESFIRLARVKGVPTIAEFVENQATLDRLCEMGVDYVQGYHLHRPELWQAA